MNIILISVVNNVNITGDIMRIFYGPAIWGSTKLSNGKTLWLKRKVLFEQNENTLEIKRIDDLGVIESLFVQVDLEGEDAEYIDSEADLTCIKAFNPEDFSPKLIPCIKVNIENKSI